MACAKRNPGCKRQRQGKMWRKRHVGSGDLLSTCRHLVEASIQPPDYVRECAPPWAAIFEVRNSGSKNPLKIMRETASVVSNMNPVEATIVRDHVHISQSLWGRGCTSTCNRRWSIAFQTSANPHRQGGGPGDIRQHHDPDGARVLQHDPLRDGALRVFPGQCCKPADAVGVSHSRPRHIFVHEVGGRVLISSRPQNTSGEASDTRATSTPASLIFFDSQVIVEHAGVNVMNGAPSKDGHRAMIPPGTSFTV